MNTNERNRLKIELGKMGIRGDYLGSWQPRRDMWRHKAQLNNFEKEIAPAGSVVSNQPTLWDHQLRLSKRGVLPWKPTAECGCKACRERDWSRAEIDDKGQIAMIEPATESFAEFTTEPEDRVKCDDCDFVVREDSKNPAGSLRFHRRKHKETVAA